MRQPQQRTFPSLHSPYPAPVAVKRGRGHLVLRLKEALAKGDFSEPPLALAMRSRRVSKLLCK